MAEKAPDARFAPKEQRSLLEFSHAQGGRIQIAGSKIILIHAKHGTEISNAIAHVLLVHVEKSTEYRGLFVRNGNRFLRFVTGCRQICEEPSFLELSYCAKLECAHNQRRDGDLPLGL